MYECPYVSYGMLDTDEKRYLYQKVKAWKLDVGEKKYAVAIYEGDYKVIELNTWNLRDMNATFSKQ